MKILSMTATFGKLDHATISFTEGLNVVEAPNEWGKSTWCAFLVAMLYGISTSSRKKTDYLPDKERYAPWCGKPMSGRIELDWNGRRITLERSQKGKIPFGNFRAYETQSGVEVAELTGENCGAVLLGVEQEVFTRAGFLRGSDLPVVEGEALRRRLNALVTTGDESGASDLLAQKLKKLKNDCRFNRSGLIPQAEAQRDALQGKLSQLESLKRQEKELQQRELATAEYAGKLKNHQVALAYQKSLQTAAHLEQADAAAEQAKKDLAVAEARCRELPTQQTAQQELSRLQQLQQQWAALQTQTDQLPEQPQAPATPAPFAGKDGRGAVQQAESDASAYRMLCKPVTPMLLILAAVFALGAVALALVKWYLLLPCLVLAGGCVDLYLKNKHAQARDRQAVARVYGNEDPDSWVALAQAYLQAVAAYEAKLSVYNDQKAQLDAKKEGIRQTAQLLTGDSSLTQTVEYWNQVLMLRQQHTDAQEKCKQALLNAQMVRRLVHTAPKPEQPDELTLSEEQTAVALQQVDFELRQLQQKLGQCQGQMQTLGDRGAMEQQLQQVQERLARLEDIYVALSIAQDTLTQTATELQRRFAPRIASRAGELFGRLTDGRYERLLLASDLSMEVAANDEDTTHGVLWRSDGTADQLYLALRLAVAEELTPEAPLVLDDAFVRFDDSRLRSALDILREYAENKQVIIFTCQTREKKLMD